jgi:hypothetical protein
MFKIVIQAVLQEAAALASLTLFVGMIASGRRCSATCRPRRHQAC